MAALKQRMALVHPLANAAGLLNISSILLTQSPRGSVPRIGIANLAKSARRHAAKRRKMWRFARLEPPRSTKTSRKCGKEFSLHLRRVHGYAKDSFDEDSR